VAALLGVALVLAIPGYRDRVQTVIVHPGSVTASAGDDAAADDSARARATESLAALLAWEDHPLLGSGPGVFPLLYQQYAPRVGYEVHIKGVGTEAGQAPTREAHNLYLGIAADTGLLGLAAFLGLVGAILVPLLIAARRLRRVQPGLAHCAAGLALALVGYLAAGLFLSLAYERYFWLLLGLSAATARLTRRRLRAAGPAAAPVALQPRGALGARTT
jgi:putative inorganic carbon (HCO3(-)) transporter